MGPATYLQAWKRRTRYGRQSKLKLDACGRLYRAAHSALRFRSGHETLEMAGHLYIDGELTISYKMKPAGNVQMGLTGTGAMLMRFGGNPSTNPDFGFLAYAEASPFLQVGDFSLDLSGLKGTALIYIDVPSPSKFKFALRMTTEINLSDLFSTVIPQLPQFIKDAVKLVGPSGGVKAELDVFADSDWWGIKMGITLDMSALLGAHLHCVAHGQPALMELTG